LPKNEKEFKLIPGQISEPELFRTNDLDIEKLDHLYDNPASLNFPE